MLNTIDWDAALAERIGAEVKRVRTQQGLTAIELSKRCETLGLRVTRVAIAQIENGHRGAKFNVSELLVLAFALKIPPAQLLFPSLPDGEVEVVPGVTTTSAKAMRWFQGFIVDTGDMDDAEVSARRKNADTATDSWLLEEAREQRTRYAQLVADTSPDDTNLHTAYESILGRLSYQIRTLTERLSND